MYKTIVDPSPAGWRYGFPKVYDNTNGRSIEEWLTDNGYPVEKYPYFICRFWDEPDIDES